MRRLLYLKILRRNRGNPKKAFQDTTIIKLKPQNSFDDGNAYIHISRYNIDL